jgi:hypothetical protein
MNTAMIESVNRSGLFSSGGAAYSHVEFSDGNGLLITDAIIVSAVEKLASTKSYSTSEGEYSFVEVVTELLTIIAFLSSDYREIALHAVNAGAAASEQSSDGPCAGTSHAQRIFHGYLATVEITLVLLYKAIFLTASFAGRAQAEWPYRDFAKFCKDCMRRAATPADCTPHKLAMLGSVLSNGGVGRKFFKCSLPKEFNRTQDLEAAFTPDELIEVRDDVNSIFAQMPSRQTFGHGRGLIEVGDTVAIIPGCKSALILRRASQGNEGNRYRLIGEAYCFQLMDWNSLPRLPTHRISLC